ncbi:hypothetical protein CSE45_2461 [Citreicella sp. SE45]|nr:hypothetical protein CSE45_2461 [Citreicella sp. SE45]
MRRHSDRLDTLPRKFFGWKIAAEVCDGEPLRSWRRDPRPDAPPPASRPETGRLAGKGP